MTLVRLSNLKFWPHVVDLEDLHGTMSLSENCLIPLAIRFWASLEDLSSDLESLDERWRKQLLRSPP